MQPFSETPTVSLLLLCARGLIQAGFNPLKPGISQHAAHELGLLLRTCQEHFPTSYPFVALLARTGLRLGEAVGLQWGDIDFNERFIEMQQTRSN